MLRILVFRFNARLSKHSTNGTFKPIQISIPFFSLLFLFSREELSLTSPPSAPFLFDGADVFLVRSAAQLDAKFRADEKRIALAKTSFVAHTEDESALVAHWCAVDPLLSAIDARRAMTCLQMAASFIESDRLLLACDQLDAALALLPRVGPIYAVRGDILLRRGQYVSAVRDFDACFTLWGRDAGPYDWRIVYRKALAHMGQQLFLRGLNLFTRALELATAARATAEQLDELRACALRCRAQVNQRTPTSDQSNTAFVAAHRARVNTELPPYVSKRTAPTRVATTNKFDDIVSAPASVVDASSAPAVLNKMIEQPATSVGGGASSRHDFSPQRLQALSAADLAQLQHESQVVFLAILEPTGAMAAQRKASAQVVIDASAATLAEARSAEGPRDGGAALLRHMLLSAELQVSRGDSRRALDIVERILEAIPTQREALLIQVGVYIGAGRYGRALEFARRGTAAYPRDPYFQLLLGDLNLQLRSHQGALKCYRFVVQLMAENNLRELRMTEVRSADGSPFCVHASDLQLRLFSSMFECGEHSVACRKLSDIVQVNPRHCQALLAAGRILYDAGKFSEALRVHITALIASPTDDIARTAITTLISSPGGVDLVRQELSQVASLGAAYEFLGIILLESDGLDQAIQLLRIALSVSGDRIASMLALAQAFELAQEFDDMVLDAAAFLRNNNTLSVGSITAEAVLQCLKPLIDVLGHGPAPKWPVHPKLVDLPGLGAQLPTPPFNKNEIKFLVTVILLYKGLFLRGHLATALSLGSVLIDVLKEYDYIDHTEVLHELAEVQLIHNLFALPDHVAVQDFDHSTDVLSTVPAVLTSARRIIYVVGESYVMPLAWRTVVFNGCEWSFQPIYMRSASLMCLRASHARGSEFNMGLQRVPPGSHMIAITGSTQMDSVLRDFVRVCRSDTYEAATESVCNMFLEFMSVLVHERRFRIAVHDQVFGLERIETMNAIMARKVAELNNPNLKMLQVRDQLVDESGALRKAYRLEGMHLHPAYLSVLAGALSSIW